MIKFGKILNFNVLMSMSKLSFKQKLAFIVGIVFLIQNTAYGIDISAKSHLRVLLVGNTQEGQKRLAETLKVLDANSLPKAIAHLQGTLSWPVAVDSKKVTVIQGFRNGPEVSSGFRHAGIDIKVTPGTEVRACQGGRVFDVVLDIRYDDMCNIRILSDDGILWTYAHLRYSSLPTGIRDIRWSPDRDIAQSYQVKPGQRLGEVLKWNIWGSSLETGGGPAHLHLQAYYHGENTPRFSTRDEMEWFYAINEDDDEFTGEPNPFSPERLNNLVDPMFLLKAVSKVKVVSLPVRYVYRMILGFLNDRAITRARLADILGLSERTIQRYLSILIETGVVVQEGYGFDAKYQIIRKIRNDPHLTFEIWKILNRLKEKSIKNNRNAVIAEISRIVAKAKHMPDYSDLLPSELTGVYLDEQSKKTAAEISEKIQIGITQNPDTHIVEILKAILPDVKGKARQSITTLLATLRDNEGEFDYDNLAYQALVNVVRQWDKRHWHAHIGDSIHESFIWNEMVVYDNGVEGNIFNKIRESIDENAGGIDIASQSAIVARLEALLKTGKTWHELDIEFKRFIIGVFKKFKIERSVAARNIESWKRMLIHVAFENFSDGVVDLNLLINIDKKFEPDTVKMLQATDEAFSEAERLAEKYYGGKKFKVNIVVSFNRSQRKVTPEYLEGVVDKIIELKNRGMHRIRGIDLSGGEFIINDGLNTKYRRTSDYKSAIEKAHNAGLITMSHLGDIGNTHKATAQDLPYRAAPERRMEIAELSEREAGVREHLRFVEDGILDAGGISDINHGTILAPKGAVITKSPSKGYSFAGQAIEDSANLETIERLLRYIREHDIEIHTCPTANINSQKIRLYKGHPFHVWLKRGIKASLNADDFYWGNVRTTLSDEIAKMMLTAYEIGEDVVLTPRFAQQISSPNQMLPDYDIKGVLQRQTSDDI